MSLNDRIAADIPFLRRFARAVTGNQARGDTHVADTLQALVANPDLFPDDIAPRIALYRAFCRNWHATDDAVTSDEGTNAWMKTAQKRLLEMSPLRRHAFLLQTVENFSRAEVAAILDISEDQVSVLIDEAGREVAEMMATSVLIIEDEPVISMDLENIVIDLGHSVCGVARTHGQALKIVHGARPGIILADIQLADGSSGLEAVNEILDSLEVPVIFVTAFPERFLSGERPEPAFLITKPFQSEAVKAMISQALFFDTRAHAA